MSRTPGFLIPSGFSSHQKLINKLHEVDAAANFTPLNEADLLHSGENNPFETPQEALAHFGVKGMHWGVRKDDHPGASRATNRAAKKDAQEFARAKMFYGEGAGTRRKLIKAKVESAAKKDPTYKAAFDHHLAQQDLGKHAAKAKSERKRKDVVGGTTKTAKGIHRQLTGGFGSVSATSAALAGGYIYAKQTGADKVIKEYGKTAVKNLKNVATYQSRMKAAAKIFDEFAKK